MEYSLSSSLVGGSGSLNPDKLSLNLQFSTDKTLTARKGPTPTFVRASTGTYFGSDGYLKSAANNVARFDHDTSYVGSKLELVIINGIDTSSGAVPSEIISFTSLDSNGFPYFSSSLFEVSYNGSYWEILWIGGSGLFAATSVQLSGTYTLIEGDAVSVSATLSLACKGLLIEESSANFATYSQLLTNVSWVTIATTASAVGIGPTAETAFEMTETSATAQHNITNTGGLTTAQAASFTSGLSYTFSVFAKKSAGSIDWIQMTGTGPAFGAFQHANFNIGTGVVGYYTGTPVGSPPKIESVGNGWYRCSLTVVATATAIGNAIGVVLTNNTDTVVRAPSYIGSTANKVLLTMAQVEQKAFPTSYIPTTTGTAPRSADLCSITSSAFTSFYNQPAGTMIVDGHNSMSSDLNNIRWTSCSPITGGRAFEIEGGSTLLRFVEPTSPLSEVTISSSFSLPSKFGLACSLNDFQGVSKGILGGVDTTATMTSPTTLNIGNLDASSSFINGCISSIQYYKKRLPNAKLIMATNPNANIYSFNGDVYTDSSSNLYTY